MNAPTLRAEPVDRVRIIYADAAGEHMLPHPPIALDLGRDPYRMSLAAAKATPESVRRDERGLFWGSRRDAQIALRAARLAIVNP